MFEIFDFNLPKNIAYCREFVDNLLHLLYYSHIPTAIVALLTGIYVYFKNRSSLLAKILLSISICFFLWSFLDLSIWINYSRASVLMFAWSLIEIFSVLLFILCFYFIYVFFSQRDASILAKFIFTLLLLPILFISPTPANLIEYDLQECVAVENAVFLAYIFYLKLFLSISILGYGLFKFKQTTAEKRRQVGLLTVGTLIFIFVFFVAGQISERTGNYTFEIYGLFGMVIFVGFLAYIIVKFQTFKIKILGVQVLVLALLALIAAQFTFIDSRIALILNLVTVILALSFGYLLIRGVKREVEQKERISQLAINLEVANARLRELDQMKSQFLSFASHQIRSPLTAIKGYTSMVLEGDFGPMSEKIKETIHIIDKSAQDLVVIVNEFLDVSRIEQGRMKYDRENFDLRELINEVVIEFKSTIEKKDLKLVVDLGREKLIINGDEGKIKQALGNIIDNAIKYTPEGEIRVSLTRSEKTGVIKISDTGVGIKASDIQKLFSMFTRAKEAHKVDVAGTGLGLYVAKEMIEAHRGKIWVRSDGARKGSIFTIELPLLN